MKDFTFVDTSVSDLIEKYIEHQRVRDAMKMKDKFKVPENRIWHIEVKTLAKTGQWVELAKLVANKKTPPIGFTPFVEACVEEKQFSEAAKYIMRINDVHEQMEWFGNIGYWKDAADIAVKEKDEEALELIKARCKQAPVMAYIDNVLASWQKKG